MILLAVRWSPANPFRPVAALGLVAIFALLFREAIQAGRAAGAQESCEAELPELCLGGEETGAAPSELPDAPVLDAAKVCVNAGYLCEGLEQRGNQRVLRWSDATKEILVHVPPPPVESPSLRHQLQSAASRGIRAWDGHPYTIRVDERGTRGKPDIVVHWGGSLQGSELGHARTEWVRTPEDATIRVLDFALATRSPFAPFEPLPARQVELTAAHEMGHALGLPHSDSPRDVMYPTNTAIALSAQDYRTMQVLYSLENGAEIRRR